MLEDLEAILCLYFHLFEHASPQPDDALAPSPGVEGDVHGGAPLRHRHVEVPTVLADAELDMLSREHAVDLFNNGGSSQRFSPALLGDSTVVHVRCASARREGLTLRSPSPHCDSD